MTLNKSGGIWFWRIGRVGGSLYLAKRKKADKPRFEYLPYDFMLALHAAPIGWVIGWAFL